MFATLVAALIVIVMGLRRLEPAHAGRATVRVASEVIAFGGALFGTFLVVGILSIDAELVAAWSDSQDGVLVSLALKPPPGLLPFSREEDVSRADFTAAAGMVTRQKVNAINAEMARELKVGRADNIDFFMVTTP